VCALKLQTYHFETEHAEIRPKIKNSVEKFTHATPGKMQSEIIHYNLSVKCNDKLAIKLRAVKLMVQGYYKSLDTFNVVLERNY